MTIGDTTTRYGYISIINHWLSAFLMLAALLIGWFMEDFGKATEEQLIEIHVAAGLSILLLTVLRLGWRGTNPKQEAISHTPDWQLRAAKITKYALYAVLLALPVTGWIMSNAEGHSVSILGIIDFPTIMSANKGIAGFVEEIHELLVNLFVGLVILHIAAALKHHFLDKDDTLTRMLPTKN